MDEILSSIRQIIADDDAASTGARAPAEHASVAAILRSVKPVEPLEDGSDDESEDEPLTLSATQIVAEDAGKKAADDLTAFAADEATIDELPEDEPLADAAADARFAADSLVEPDDVTFAAEPAPAPAPVPVAPPRPVVAAAPPPVVPRRPQPTAAQAAPMPDPTLSSDIAEQLLEPTTNSAVRANFARLNSLGVGQPGLTIEAMMREMLRPLLKEWLDEHLPTVVERIVEKEISRISRGVE